ncbi:MAG: hypothetical protein V4454_20570, partial [Pseudomonadota bacterium]
RSSRGLKQLASLKQVSALIRLVLRFSAPLQGFGEDECKDKKPMPISVVCHCGLDPQSISNEAGMDPGSSPG